MNCLTHMMVRNGEVVWNIIILFIIYCTNIFVLLLFVHFLIVYVLKEPNKCLAHRGIGEGIFRYTGLLILHLFIQHQWIFKIPLRHFHRQRKLHPDWMRHPFYCAKETFKPLVVKVVRIYLSIRVGLLVHNVCGTPSFLM